MGGRAGRALMKESRGQMKTWVQGGELCADGFMAVAAGAEDETAGPLSTQKCPSVMKFMFNGRLCGLRIQIPRMLFLSGSRTS